MAAISAALVKELRERTGSGMMECKKALVAAEGDIEKAVEEMRKAGQAKADKKSSRTAADGVVVIEVADNNKRAVLVEINSETDFVARDESFIKFADNVSSALLKSGATDDQAIADTQLASGETIESARQNLITKLGENMKVRRAEVLDTDGVIGAYVHSGRIGVLVELSGDDACLAKDIAMHIAASNPMVINQNDVPAELLEKEKEIFIAQAQDSGKPAEIIEKMTEGRLRKYLDEVSLMGQPFVKDPSQKISDLLKASNAAVKHFVRFGVGEGIEKEEVDFVKEVMQQAQGA